MLTTPKDFINPTKVHYKVSDNDSEPIPICNSQFSDFDDYQYGLSKREHFAAIAMQGLLSNPEIKQSTTNVALEAVLYADALITALNQPK